MSQQTVRFQLDVPYKDQEGNEQVRSCVLTLSLSVADLSASTCQEDGLGEITMQGAVIVVEDPMGKPTPTTEEEPLDEEPAEQRAA